MIGLLGYNFFADSDCANPSPTYIADVNDTTIQNGIFNHFNIDSSVSFEYSDIIPDKWDFSTVMDANFEGNINAGNLRDIAANITGYRIKRRVKGDFDWVTLKEETISDVDELSFSWIDRLNLNFTNYEYAFVPMMNTIEGTYIIKEIYSKFEGVYICDASTIYKFMYGVAYGDTDRVQQVNVFTPFGREKPIVISNGLINYETGSITGKIFNNDYESTRQIDRNIIAKNRKIILNYLTNKSPKIIKDWNGNAWLVYIINNPSVQYDSNYGMGVINVTADWVEIGDINSKADLYKNGFIPTEE